MRLRLFLCAWSVLLWLVAVPVSAKIIVNEVLSNEPARYTGLEWFELYNDGPATVNLILHPINVGVSQFILNDSIPPSSFLVVCRNLVGIPASPGFETYWGNNSSIWGDAPQENFRVIEASFVLSNAFGSVSVLFLGDIESELAWNTSGGDGVSWERDRPISAVIGQCLAPSGSTPGGINSLTPMARDLALDSIVASWHDGLTKLTATITSRSINSVTGAELLLYIVDPADSNNTTNQLANIPLPTVDTGFTTEVVREFTIPATYARVGGLLSTDDRAYNNRWILTAPGQSFPPVVLSEFLANPEGNIVSEWVELYNREDTTISLAGWRLGDSTQLSDPLPLVTIPSRAFLVVTQDTAAFLQSYFSFNGSLAEVSLWPSLNNSGDRLRLIDAFGLEADTFAYSETYSGNSTWGKDLVGNRWGRSVDSGGTPGGVNDLRFAQEGSSLKVELSPRIFSPDNDGIDDTVAIFVTAPKADGYTLRIYDVHGQLVRAFENKAGDLAARYVWDGRDDSGGRLQVGIYILYVEAVGVESVKKTLVVAR